MVSLTWLPAPNVTFEFEGEVMRLDVGGGASLSLIDIPDAPAARISINHLTLDCARGTFQESFSFGSKTATSVVFLLPNMPEIMGELVSTEGGGGWAGRVHLPDPPWRIELESRRDISAIVSELKRGGFAATHVGRLDRADGSSFATADALATLEGLGQFLSLARGLWTTPLLLVGYEGDLPVWHEWCARHASPWRTNFAWFSPRHADSLTAAFPPFMERWRNLGWRDTLVLGIGWFVEANQLSNAESSIVLGQVALELFAWAILVDEHEIVYERASRGQQSRTSARSSSGRKFRWLSQRNAAI